MIAMFQGHRMRRLLQKQLEEIPEPELILHVSEAGVFVSCSTATEAEEFFADRVKWDVENEHHDPEDAEIGSIIKMPIHIGLSSIRDCIRIHIMKDHATVDWDYETGAEFTERYLRLKKEGYSL